MKTKLLTEHQEQAKLIQWLKLKGIRHNSTPNAAKRSFYTAAAMKREGMAKGFPDLTIFLENMILYIELKRQKGGVVSAEQREWVEFLNSLPYASSAICKGFDEAREWIEKIGAIK